jgi:hypothetical protein
LLFQVAAAEAGHEMEHPGDTTDFWCGFLWGLWYLTGLSVGRGCGFDEEMFESVGGSAEEVGVVFAEVGLFEVEV